MPAYAILGWIASHYYYIATKQMDASDTELEACDKSFCDQIW